MKFVCRSSWMKNLFCFENYQVWQVRQYNTQNIDTRQYTIHEAQKPSVSNDSTNRPERLQRPALRRRVSWRSESRTEANEDLRAVTDPGLFRKKHLKTHFSVWHLMMSVDNVNDYVMHLCPIIVIGALQILRRRWWWWWWYVNCSVADIIEWWL